MVSLTPRFCLVRFDAPQHEKLLKSHRALKRIARHGLDPGQKLGGALVIFGKFVRKREHVETDGGAILALINALCGGKRALCIACPYREECFENGDSEMFTHSRRAAVVVPRRGFRCGKRFDSQGRRSSSLRVTRLSHDKKRTQHALGSGEVSRLGCGDRLRERSIVAFSKGQTRWRRGRVSGGAHAHRFIRVVTFPRRRVACQALGNRRG